MDESQSQRRTTPEASYSSRGISRVRPMGTAGNTFRAFVTARVTVEVRVWPRVRARTRTNVRARARAQSQGED